MRQLPARIRGLTAIDGATCLIVILFVFQMWLLTATLKSFLAGHQEEVIAAAVVAGLLDLACLALYLFICEVDAQVGEDWLEKLTCRRTLTRSNLYRS